MQHGHGEIERGEDNSVAHHIFSGVSVTVETCFSLYLFVGMACLIRHESFLPSSSLQMFTLKTSKIWSTACGRRLGSFREKMSFRTGAAAVSLCVGLLWCCSDHWVCHTLLMRNAGWTRHNLRPHEVKSAFQIWPAFSPIVAVLDDCIKTQFVSKSIAGTPTPPLCQSWNQ